MTVKNTITQCSCGHDHTDRKTEKRLRELVSRTNDFELISNMFALLNDANRMRIFWMLCHCEECVAGIAGITGMSSPAVSHHLRNLKTAGLIESTRRGKEVFYRATMGNTASTLHETIENLLGTYCPQSEGYIIQESVNRSAELRENQSDIVKEIHDYLLSHLSERITIEALAKKYHINTTSLKNSFKKLYGNSIAAHIKEHRMEKARELIQTSNQPLFEIGKAVGYDSQSKFTAAFREHFGVSPSEYKKGL